MPEFIGEPNKPTKPSRAIVGDVGNIQIALPTDSLQVYNSVKNELFKQGLIMDYLIDDTYKGFKAFGDFADMALQEAMDEDGDIMVDDNQPELIDALNCPCCNPNFGTPKQNQIGFDNIRSAERVMISSSTSIGNLTRSLVNQYSSDPDRLSYEVQKIVSDNIAAQVAAMWGKLLKKIIYAVTVKPIYAITCGLFKVTSQGWNPLTKALKLVTQKLCKKCKDEIHAQEIETPWFQGDLNTRDLFGKKSVPLEGEDETPEDQLFSEDRPKEIDPCYSDICNSHSRIILNHVLYNSKYNTKMAMFFRTHLKRGAETFKYHRNMERATRPVIPADNIDAFFFGMKAQQEDENEYNGVMKKGPWEEWMKEYGGLFGDLGWTSEDFGPGGNLDPTTQFDSYEYNKQWWRNNFGKDEGSLEEKIDDIWKERQKELEETAESWWNDSYGKKGKDWEDQAINEAFDEYRKKYSGFGTTISSLGDDLVADFKNTDHYFDTGMEYGFNDSDYQNAKDQVGNFFGGPAAAWDEFKKGFKGGGEHIGAADLIGKFWSDATSENPKKVFSDLLGVDVAALWKKTGIGQEAEGHVYDFSKGVDVFDAAKTGGSFFSHLGAFLLSYLKSLKWMDSQLVCCLIANFLGMAIDPAGKLRKFLLLILAIIQLLKRTWVTDILALLGNLLDILKQMYNDIVDALMDFIANVITNLIAFLAKLLKDLFDKLPFLQCLGLIQLLANLLKYLEELLNKLLELLRRLLKMMMGDVYGLNLPLQLAIKANWLDMIEKIILLILTLLAKYELCRKKEEDKMSTEYIPPDQMSYQEIKKRSLPSRTTIDQDFIMGRKKRFVPKGIEYRFPKHRQEVIPEFYINPENYSPNPSEQEMHNLFMNLGLTDPQIDIFLEKAGGYQGCLGMVGQQEMEMMSKAISDAIIKGR